MSTGNNVEEVIPSDREFQLPTGQGVPDIWDEIFEYITDPEDLHHLLLASRRYFDSLLEKHKPVILLPPVLEILCRKDYLPMSDVLKCRLVSKRFKSLVDNLIRVGNPCFENFGGHDHDKFNPRHDEHHCWRHKIQSLGLRNPGHYREYAADTTNGIFTPGGLSPFLLGVAILQKSNNSDGFPQLLRDMRLLLTNFGPQIHHLTLRYLWEPGANGYWVLQELLGLMPNLRTLELERLCNTNMDGCKKVIESRPLPDLNHLVVLKMNVVPSPILNALLRKYMPQLEKLWIGNPNHNQGWCLHDDTLFATGVNLKHISLPMMSSRDDVNCYLNDNISWPESIRSLTLTVNLVKDSKGVLQELCSALQNSFGNLNRNLQNLNIRFTTDETHPLFEYHNKMLTFLLPSARLILPSVKCLWIFTRFVAFSNVDFLLGLSSSLEELTLNLDRSLPMRPLTEENAVEGIQWVGYWDRMYDSNIWQLMPKLHHLTIRRTDGDEDRLPWNNYEYTRQDIQ